MNVGNLSHKMELMVPVSYAKNNYGEKNTTYTQSSIWGSLVSRIGADVLCNGYMGSDEVYVFVVRNNPNITNLTKVLYKEKVFNVTSVGAVASNRNYTQITIELKSTR